MKQFLVHGLFSVVVFVLSGCGENSKVESAAVETDKVEESSAVGGIAQETPFAEEAALMRVSAEDTVRERLARKGISLGLDSEKGRLTVIGRCGIAIPLKPSVFSSDKYSVELDFPIPETNELEAVRFYCTWSAYADAVADIAGKFDTRVECDAENNVFIRSTQLRLNGVKMLTCAESFDAGNGVYEVAVAVGVHPKDKFQGDGTSVRKFSKPGKYSLDEYIENIVKGQCVTMVPRSIVDTDGVEWRLGFSPLAAGNDMSYEAKKRMAGRFAYEAALRADNVEVSDKSMLHRQFKEENGAAKSKKSKKHFLCFLKPMLHPGKSSVRFFSVEGKSPFNGDVRYCVCAIKVE